MHETIKKYKDELKEELKEYMAMPITANSVKEITSMLECYDAVCDFEKEYGSHEITKHEAREWVESMENADGTKGEKWGWEDAEKYREKFYPDIKPCLWFIALNMMYSDYSEVARKYGVDSPRFYADMAHAFLQDKDGGTPEEKIDGYYRGIVDAE